VGRLTGGRGVSALPTALHLGGKHMDLTYLERRLEEERQRIAEATCPEAARAHRELAEEYEARIAVLRGARRPTLHLVTR